jgi:hypothetical protein
VGLLRFGVSRVPKYKARRVRSQADLLIAHHRSLDPCIVISAECAVEQPTT